MGERWSKLCVLCHCNCDRRGQGVLTSYYDMIQKEVMASPTLQMQGRSGIALSCVICLTPLCNSGAASSLELKSTLRDRGIWQKCGGCQVQGDVELPT